MRGFKAGETSIIKQNEKFEVLYNRANRSPENSNGLVKPLTATNYDEFYMTAFYSYNDESAPTHTYAAMWSTRYPIDAMMHKTNVGAFGSDNYMWTHANQYDPATEIRGFYQGNFSGYAYPFMYIGVKDQDAQRTTLYHDGTAAIRTDITLSDSIFNYDELILTFATGAYQSNNHTTASAYPVSTIQIGKQLCGFNDYNGSYFRYEVTSATQLTLVSYQDFYLVDVQGIKNSSMEETVIFTNPSSSSVPATVTLSQTYKNFDEICLVGHTADAQFEDMIVTQYYPVKALAREFDIPVDKRIGLFLDVENCWLSIHGDTTLVPDTTSPTIILDKIIGIKKPLLVTAADYADITSLSVTQNGTYTAPSGKAYSPVVVDVQEQPWQPLEDGYSNFWFELTDDTLSPWLNFSKKNNDATIDWGDGSGEQALDTLTPTHTYSKAGKYVVKVKGVTGIARQNVPPFLDKYLSVLKYIELNEEITSLVSYTFSYCSNLRKVIMPTTVATAGGAVFQYCSLLNDVDSMLPLLSSSSGSVFSFCFSFAEIDIPEGVTGIGTSSFYYCVSLKKVTLPTTITSIYATVFRSCSSLNELHIKATEPPTLGSNTFQDVPSDFIIYVPVGTGDTYKAAAGWSTYADHILEEGQQVTRAMQRKLDNSVDGVITENLDDIEREEEER